MKPTLRQRERGQSTTEYMLVISVIVIALVGVLYQPLNDAMTAGSADLNSEVVKNTKAGGWGMNGEEQR